MDSITGFGQDFVRHMVQKESFIEQAKKEPVSIHDDVEYILQKLYDGKTVTAGELFLSSEYDSDSLMEQVSGRACFAIETYYDDEIDTQVWVKSKQ